MHFVAVMPKELRVLNECGCRHTLVSFAFIDKFGGTLSEARELFDTVFTDSGAFTAFSMGYEVSESDYYDWLKKEKGNYDVAAQLDVLFNPKQSILNYKNAIDNGIDWILPIAQPYSRDNWDITIKQLEKIANLQPNDYVGIGGFIKPYEKRGLENVIKYLPRKYRYHGFAKVVFPLMQKNYFYSVDSSSWSRGIGFGSMQVWDKGKRALQVSVGRVGKGDKLVLDRLYDLHKEDCEACGITKSLLLDGDRDTLQKAYIALYYRPRIREIGQFKDNFRF